MRILLVEEDKFVSEQLNIKLKDDFTSHVDSVKYIQKGLRFLKSEKPYDFIIADYQSHKDIGYEILLFKVRHYIPGKFIFYTNIELESKSSYSIVKRLSYKNLHQYILKNV